MIREYVVAMRFLTTMGHFLALLILFSTIPNNIRVSLGDGVSATDEKVAQQTAIVALVIGICCFMFDFRGMFFGSSLFNHTVRHIIVHLSFYLNFQLFYIFVVLQTNFIQILFHFVGSIFLSLFITENWGYQALWPIIIACSFPPAFSEIAMIIRVRFLKSTPY